MVKYLFQMSSTDHRDACWKLGTTFIEAIEGNTLEKKVQKKI